MGGWVVDEDGGRGWARMGGRMGVGRYYRNIADTPGRLRDRHGT